MKKPVNLSLRNSSGFLKQEDAIAEKIAEIQEILSEKINYEELSDRITTRRTNWLKENLEKLRLRYNELSPEEMAHRIIYLEHMNIDPIFSVVTRVSPTKIRIDSLNFCPYLEACKKLGLDTRDICQKVNDKCLDDAVKMIHPKLKFYRNYKNVRPHSKYCEEYIELSQ